MTEPAPFLALIVDDSRSARFALGKFLENLGLVADSAADLDATQLYLETHRPDIVFVDHDAADVDFGELRALKQYAPLTQVPLVLCAADDSPELKTAALAHGAAAFMLKPPLRAELGELLTHLIPGYVPPDQLAPLRGTVHEDLHGDGHLETSEPVASPTLSAAPDWEDHAAEPLPEIVEEEVTDDRADQLAQHLAARAEDIRGGLASIDPYAAPAPGAAAPFVEEPVEETPFEDLPPAAPIAAAPEPDLPKPPEPMPAPVIESTPPDARLLQLEARLRLLEQNVQSQLMEVRMQLDLNTRAQVERIEQSRESIRAMVAQEAQIVAERTVMDAAEQMSDRLAESILRTLNRE